MISIVVGSLLVRICSLPTVAIFHNVSKSDNRSRRSINAGSYCSFSNKQLEAHDYARIAFSKVNSVEHSVDNE